MLTSTEARPALEYWERLPKEERDKAEEDLKRRIAEMERVRRFLDRQGPAITMTYGAIVIGGCAASFLPTASSGWMVFAGIFGALLGASAGYLLLRLHGGILKGMVSFGGAFFLTTIVTVMGGGVGMHSFGSMFLAGGMAFAFGAGVMLGLYIDRAYERAL